MSAMSMPYEYIERFMKMNPQGFSVTDLVDAFLVEQALEKNTDEARMERDLFQLAAKASSPTGVVAGCIRAMSYMLACVDDKAAHEILRSFCKMVLAQRVALEEIAQKLDELTA